MAQLKLRSLINGTSCAQVRQIKLCLKPMMAIEETSFVGLSLFFFTNCCVFQFHIIILSFESTKVCEQLRLVFPKFVAEECLEKQATFGAYLNSWSCL